MLTLFEDGSISVAFHNHDGPCSLHMSPSGSCFVVENIEGVVVKQQSHLASSQFRSMVTQALFLRNRYTHTAPFLRYDMLDEESQKLIQKFPCKLEHARWLKRPIVRESEDGSRLLESIENLISLRLWPCKLLVDVSYPARVLGDSSKIGRFAYIYLTQTFIVSETPQIWQELVDVLLNYEHDPVLNTDIIAIPPTNERISPADTVNALFCPSSADNGKKAIRLIIKNEWIYWPNYLNGSMEMISLNMSTQNLVESFRGFHFVRFLSLTDYLDQQDGQVFSVSNFLNPETEIPSKYEFLRDVIHQGHALAVQNTYAIAHTEKDPKLAATKFSSTVKETVVQENVGQFIAFQDGRVRVTFDDRVILELSSDQQSARILTRTGNFVDVRTENPVGYEQHIRYAIKFAKWAFAGTEERRNQEEITERARKALKLSAIANQLYLKQLENRPNNI